MITFLTAWLKKHHWIHDWEKWEAWEGYTLPYAMESLKVRVTKQQRCCKVCRKREIV